jgi:hypothetical protein
MKQRQYTSILIETDHIQIARFRREAGSLTADSLKSVDLPEALSSNLLDSPEALGSFIAEQLKDGTLDSPLELLLGGGLVYTYAYSIKYEGHRLLRRAVQEQIETTARSVIDEETKGDLIFEDLALEPPGRGQMNWRLLYCVKKSFIEKLADSMTKEGVKPRRILPAKNKYPDPPDFLNGGGYTRRMSRALTLMLAVATCACLLIVLPLPITTQQLEAQIKANETTLASEEYKVGAASLYEYRRAIASRTDLKTAESFLTEKETAISDTLAYLEQKLFADSVIVNIVYDGSSGIVCDLVTDDAEGFAARRQAVNAERKVSVNLISTQGAASGAGIELGTDETFMQIRVTGLVAE